MALITPHQRSFNGGLWSPRLQGRSDLQPYETSLTRCVNMVPTVGGLARRRPGTLFKGETKNATGSVRFLPFIFSASDALVLELTDSRARFWKNGALVLSGGLPYEVSTPYLSSELYELDWASDADVVILAHRAHETQVLSRIADDNWTVESLTPRYGPYLQRGELAPSVIASTPGLADGTPVWLAFNGGVPSSRDMRVSLPSITFTVRAGAGFAAASVAGTFLSARDVGRKIIVNSYDQTVTTSPAADLTDAEVGYPLWGTITDVTSTTVTVEFYDGYWFGTNISTQMWFLDAFFEQPGVISEWPGVCTFFEDRLWLGSTNLAPDTVYASRTGLIDDFDVFSASDSNPQQQPTTYAGTGILQLTPSDQAEVLATSGMAISISGQELSQIEWIRPAASSLVIGTSRSVHQVIAVNQNQVFGPTEAISVRPTNATGSTRTGVISLRDRIYFLSPSEQRLFRIGFSLAQDGFVSSEVSLYNPDILAPGVLDAVVARDPESIWWAATRDGKLIGLTLEESQQVFAWHEHELGGGGTVEAITSIPDPTSGEDQLWLAVRRTINGVSVRYVEILDESFDDDRPDSDQVFSDSAIQYAGGVTTTIAGLGHLVGQTVQVLGDGAPRADEVVSPAGTITIELPGVTSATIGLRADAELHGASIAVLDPQGPSLGKTQNSSQALVALVRSGAAEVSAGSDPDDMIWFQVPKRTGATPLGSAPLETGLYVVTLNARSGLRLRPGVRSAVPTNLEVSTLGLWMDLSTR